MEQTVREVRPHDYRGTPQIVEAKDSEKGAKNRTFVF